MNSLVILVLSCFFTANLALDQSGQPEVWPEGWPEGDHQQWYPDIHKPVKPTNSRPPNCQMIPKDVFKNQKIFSTSFLLNTAYYYAVLPCDSGSVFSQIEYELINQTTKLFCSGVAVTDDYFLPYQVSFSNWKDQGQAPVPIKQTNYTRIDTWFNGNAYTLECGTISGGPCDGDEIWSVGIYSGQTQEGCLGLDSGLGEIDAIARKLYVNGKCTSRCSLGQSYENWDPSIANTAIVPDFGRRDLDVSDRKTKKSNLCQVIPKHLKTLEFSPIVNVNVTTFELYLCLNGSIIVGLAYDEEVERAVTCNGVVVSTGDISYVGFFADDTIDLITITVENSQQMFAFSNGNLGHLECGIIKGGPCDGDELWTVVVLGADSQEYCASSGVSFNYGQYGLMEVNGKCQSRCPLSVSVIEFSPEVNNHGTVQGKRQAKSKYMRKTFQKYRKFRQNF